MKGDFSRLTFRPDRGYAGVLMQQGRVLLDSDWNEQAMIMLEAVRGVVRDLLGVHGGVGDAFRIRPHRDGQDHPVKRDFLIEEGSYYVHGIRCVNAATFSYRQALEEQRCAEDASLRAGVFLVYLEVWERPVTAVEDPELREQAIGGPDTSVRLRVLWRVRILRSPPSTADAPDEVLAATFARKAPAGMRARVAPGAGYSGLENHLYRVEIHEGGRAAQATFKWSRDNASVTAAVAAVEPDRVVIAPSLAGASFTPGAWIEPEDATTALCGSAPPLMRIGSVDGHGLITSPAWPLEQDESVARWIRRWDHGATGDPERGGAVALAEGRWLDLEDGIQIAFDDGGDYRSGDAWVIPARTAGRDIVWPTDADEPASQSPITVDRFRAPLALVEIRRDGTVRVLMDLRRLFEPIATGPGG